MSLVLHNTLTGRKETFIPLQEGRVKMYVCGPTVYDDSHIGHARAGLVFDVLYRHLISLGYETTYVRNLTDVDDKIINRANQQGEDFNNLAERFIRSYHEDMDRLGALRPDLEPRATENIGRMIEDIEALIQKGIAYEVDGDVFFDVTAYPDYGRLSGRSLEDMKAGARVQVDDRKKNPWDFALWKKSKPGEPAWDSPWGPGRPGWHIECSAMSRDLLGEDFDIHGGGHDLVFPHHENEIAQSRALGRGFARYWVHNGFVRVDNEKMSKSLNNFRTIKDILLTADPEVLRLFLLSKHYRSPIDFSEEGLQETRRSLDRIYRTLANAADLGIRPQKEAPQGETSDLRAKFREAMNDDLNTARALGCIFEAVKELNKLLDQAVKAEPDTERIQAWTSAVADLGDVLGILHQDPKTQWGAAGIDPEAAPDDQPEASGPDAAWIEEQIQARARARSEKNWAEADRIRDELKEKGIILEDKGGVTTWRPAG